MQMIRGNNLIYLVWVALLFLSGCQPPIALIQTDPPGAKVTMNGVDIGQSPVTHIMDFESSPQVIIGASLVGYYDKQVIITKGEGDPRQLNLVLLEDQRLKATVPSDAANNWLRLQIDTTLTYNSLWLKVIDVVTSRYPSLEMIDDKSGYLQSKYVTRQFKSAKGEVQVRTRFIGNIASEAPLLYRLKIESDTKDTGDSDWRPYPRILREDEQLIEEIQGRVGPK